MVHDCIVFVDFCQSNNLFRVKIECNLFSSTQSASRECIFGLYQWLSEECIWVYSAEKYMRHICPALHISTSYGIFTSLSCNGCTLMIPKTVNFPLNSCEIFRIPFLAMHQTYNTIILCECCHRRIHKHHLSEISFIKKRNSQIFLELMVYDHKKYDPGLKFTILIDSKWSSAERILLFAWSIRSFIWK